MDCAGLGHSVDNKVTRSNENFTRTDEMLAEVPRFEKLVRRVMFTDNAQEVGEAREDLQWTHCTSRPNRSETNGIAGGAVRRVKEGTSAILLQARLDEHMLADSSEC